MSTTTSTTLTAALVRAIDRPAREALELARRPILHTIAPGMLGLFLIAVASLIAVAIDPALVRRSFGLFRVDALRAGLEALAVVVPGTIVFATYTSLRITPRALLAAVAIGALVAGIVAMSLIPLIAFLAVVNQAGLAPIATPSLIVPAVAVASLAVTPVRVIRAVDPSPKAAWVARAFVCALLVVFALRVQPYAAEIAPLHRWFY